MTKDITTQDQFDALLDRLESTELDATVNLASNLTTALRIVSSYPAVQSLVHACEDDPSLITVAYARLIDLCRRPVDRIYASPYDSAIFALLFLFENCEPLAAASAAAAAVEATNTHWAARFAILLLDGVSRRAPPADSDDALLLASREQPVALCRRHSTMTRPVQEVSFRE